jgi:acetyl esterase/lipase
MSMRRTAAALGIGLSLWAPSASAQEPVIPLWPGAAPGSESWTQRETESPAPWDAKARLVRNVVRPTLTAYLPERAKATGAAVIVAPGGGFRFLSWASEGTQVAEWLLRRGIAAFVLKYRTIDTGATEKEFVANVNAMMDRLGQAGPSSRDVLDPEMQKMALLAAEDGRQAVRVVRQRAAEWGLAPDRIGLLGFSAGAIVTTEVALDHDAASRPDFAAPIYGGPLRRVTPPDDAPPLFVVWASDDPLISPVRGTDLYLAWYGARRPAELHVYASGGHGFGMQARGLPSDRWIERFEEWLQGLKRMGAKGTQ